MTAWHKVGSATVFIALAMLLAIGVAPVEAKTVKQFHRTLGGEIGNGTRTFHVQSVMEIEEQLAQLTDPNDPRVYGDYALISAADTLYVDAPLVVNPAAMQGFYIVSLYFGVQHKPQQRLNLVCRNASTALIVRTPVAIGNLDISNCGDSGVVIDLPTAAHQLSMLYFGIHNNRGMDGAGLRVVTGSVTFNDMDISYNRASRNGGGLHVGKNACVTFQERLPKEIEDSSQPRYNFTRNWAEGKGGAIYLDNPHCNIEQGEKLYVRDAVFLNNTAQQAGGAVYVTSGSHALQETAALFYSLRTQALDLGFQHTKFSRNKALGGTGGAVHVAEFQNILILDDALFVSNTAAVSGGALWAASALLGQVSVSGAVFVANKAGPALPEGRQVTDPSEVVAASRQGVGYGGAMYLTGSLQASFQRGTGIKFKGNSAAAEGGAIHCAFCSSLLVSDVEFAGNTAAGGGAICMDRVSSSSLIKDNRFVGNVAACPGVGPPADGTSTVASAGAAGAGAKGYTCGCGGGGAVCIRSASSLELSGSAFLNNSGYAGGALYINQDDCLLPVKPPCSVRVVNHTFTSNTAAAAGGAIYLAAPFESNIPLGNLNPSTDSITSPPDASFEGSHVPACVSAVNAHVRSFRPSPTVPSSDVLNTFTNNSILGSPPSAGYGPDVATAVACMLRANTLLPHTSPSSTKMRNVAQPHVVAASGDTFSLLLRSYDAYGQLISRPLPHVMFTATATSSAGGNSSSGVAPSVSVTAPSQAVFNPALRCLELQNLSLFSINDTVYNLAISAIVSSLQPVAQTVVTVQLRPCCIGQVATGRSCKSCLSATARNQYSFNPQNQTCDRCPSRAVCGGSTLMPMDGYWHASPRSDKLYLCPVRDACSSPSRVATLEGFQQQLLGTCGQPGLAPADVRRYSQVQCRQGYGGNACGNCHVGGEKTYGRKGQVCSTCASRSLSILAFVALKLCEALLVACLVLARMTKTKKSPGGLGLAPQPSAASQQSPGQLGLPTQSSVASLRSTMTSPILGTGAGTSIGPVCSSSRQGLRKLSGAAATYLAALLEILVVHVQVLGLLASAQIGWPTHLFSFFNALRFHEASSIWMSPDCLLPQGASNVAFWRIVIITLSPSGTIVLLVVAWLCFAIVRQRCSTEQHAKGIRLQTAAAIAIAYSTFYYPSIVNTTLSVFTCMPLDPPGATYDGLPSIASSSHGWWKQDYDMQCFTGFHLVFSLAYGLPFLLLFAVGVPVFITHFLWRHRSNGMLSDNKFQAKFGYMYTDYRESCWFWFCMRFWLLLALSAAVQGLSYYGPLRQLITIGLCLSLVLLLQLGFKPYQSQLVNSVYAAMLYTVVVTVYLSFAYATPSLTVHPGTMWVVISLNAAVVAVQLAIIAAGLIGMRAAVAGATNAVMYNAVTSMKSAVIAGSLKAYSKLVHSHRSGNGPSASAGNSAA